MLLRNRIALAVVPAVAVASIGVFAATSSASSRAAPTSFSATVTGTAMRSLDERVAPQLVPNTGGGVTPAYEDGAPPSTSRVWLEASVDLPINAKVTSVSFTVTPGDRTGCLGEPLEFGSYNPANGSFAAHVSFTTPTHASPCKRQTFTKSGNPITTIAAGRHYVIEWYSLVITSYPGDAFTSGIFHGATVKYSCTSPCVP